MSEKVDIIKKVYGKSSFQNVVNTKFGSLISSAEEDNEIPEGNNVESFFQLYDNIFYDIPLSGSDQSHMGILIKSSDYLGISLIDLEEEIRSLREENVSLKNKLFNSSFGNQNITVD